MLFLEKKTENGYEYTTEEFIGSFIFRSSEKIEPKILDNCVFALSPTNGGKGELKNKNQIIYYEFVKNDAWLEDEEL